MDIALELDTENDQLYVLFRPDLTFRGSVARTVRLNDDVVADLDADGRLVGLDVSCASRALGITDIRRVSVAVDLDGSRRKPC